MIATAAARSQLCINYANEKLQQLFNAHTFKQEEECYKEEGVEYVHVDFIDNQPVLSLLEAARPPGIFKMLDDEVRLHSGTESA